MPLFHRFGKTDTTCFRWRNINSDRKTIKRWYNKTMRNFNRGNNRFSEGRDFKRMHQATCSKCGNDCEVPFRPSGTKPVFCSKCFQNNRNSDPRRYEERNTSGNTEGQYKKQFESLNWKLDKILKILTPAVSPTVAQEVKIEKEVLKPKKKKQTVKK